MCEWEATSGALSLTVAQPQQLSQNLGPHLLPSDPLSPDARCRAKPFRAAMLWVAHPSTIRVR